MHSFIAKSLLALISLQTALTLAKPVESLDKGIGLQTPKSQSFSNIVYFASWGVYGRNYQVTDLPASEITHVLYAFQNFGPNGTVVPGDPWADFQRPLPGDNPANDTGVNAYGSIKQLYKLKKANRNFKTLLSIGGWTWSTHFATVASNAATRANFAKSAVGLLKDWGFDGIDVDWEYPETEAQAKDMVLLLQAVRDELDAYSAKHANNYHFLLTIAAPAGPQRIEVLKLAELGSLLDHVNLMAYDYSGSWLNTTGHLSAVFASRDNPVSTPTNTDQAVKKYLAGGVPSNKLILGMPIYGQAFENTTGIGQPFNGVGPGQWEAGKWDYKTLPKAGAKVVCDRKVLACYSYDKATKELISFDTPGLVRDKVRYAKGLGLGGSMFWEASGDKKGEDSLIRASYKSLRKIESEQNWLSYPESQYANIASGSI